MELPSNLLIVVGMNREARIACARGRVAIGVAGIAAAMATRPTGLISFGLCGALDPALRVGDLLVADGVVSGDRRWSADPLWAATLRAALPDARRGDMAAGNRIVGSAAAKTALRRSYGAVGADMESHAVAREAEAAGLPFAVLRAVSDSARRVLPLSAQAGFKVDGDPDVAAVIAALIARPWELPALMRTALEAATGFKALARAAASLSSLPGR